MRVTVCFYSYFKDLAGCARVTEEMPKGSTLGELFRRVAGRFPKLAEMERSTLMAVGVDYHKRSYVLKPGDEISFFPPVQGG
jgi:molybdopterin converting factor small subunit